MAAAGGTLADELTSLILRDLEEAGPGGVVARKKPAQARLKREDCRKIEDAARARFCDRGSPMFKASQASSSSGPPRYESSQHLAARSKSLPAMRPASGKTMTSDVPNGSAGASLGVSAFQAGAAARSSAPRLTHFKERGFGISNRPEIYTVLKDNLSPGEYETQNIGTMVFRKPGKETAVSHPAQQLLSHHKTPIMCSFGRPKEFVGLSKPPRLASAPGPGHYNTVNYWDPLWQRYPALGTSLARKVPYQGESRFGRLARGAKGAKSEDHLF